MSSKDLNIRTNRSQLVQLVAEGGDTAQVIARLLQYHGPLISRYELLEITGLVRDNSTSLALLRKLPAALAILEKYGYHLLRPPDSRSTQWKTIKFSNQTFAERVDIVRGGRQIMQQLGYTQNIPDGLAFPDGKEPNPDTLVHLLSEIKLAKAEIDSYLNGSHPYVPAVEEFIPDNTRTELAESLGQHVLTAGIDLSMYYPPITPPAYPTSLFNDPQTPPTFMQNSVAVHQNAPVHQIAPVTTSSGYEGQHNQQTDLICDICGSNSAQILCTLCDNKQLCKTCNIKWHQHPKRQLHTPNYIGVQGSSIMPVRDVGGMIRPDISKQSMVKSIAPLYPEVVQNSYMPQSVYGSGMSQAQQMSAMYNMPNIVDEIAAGRTISRDHPLSQSIGTQGGWDPSVLGHGDMGHYSMLSQREEFIPNLSEFGSVYEGVGSLHSSRSSPNLDMINRTASMPHHRLYNALNTVPRNSASSRVSSSIMSIANLEERKARINISLITFDDEIQQLDRDINRIIATNAEFFDDSSYLSLQRRKGILMRERMQLESYHAELSPLAQRYNSSQGPHAVQQLVDFQNQVPSSNISGHLPAQRSAYYPDHSRTSHTSVSNPVFYPAHIQQTMYHLASPEPMDISPETVMNIDTSQNFNVPQAGSSIMSHVGNVSNTRTYPYNPSVLNLLGTQCIPYGGVSSPYVGAGGVFQAPPQSPSLIMTPAALSPAVSTSNTAQMTRSPGSVHTPSKHARKKPLAYDQPWNCRHCTYVNPAETRICSVCHKTSDNPVFSNSSSIQHSTSNHASEPVETVEASGVLGKRLRDCLEEGDQVMREKYEAKKRDEENMRQQKQEGSRRRRRDKRKSTSENAASVISGLQQLKLNEHMNGSDVPATEDPPSSEDGDACEGLELGVEASPLECPSSEEFQAEVLSDDYYAVTRKRSQIAINTAPEVEGNTEVVFTAKPVEFPVGSEQLKLAGLGASIRRRKSPIKADLSPVMMMDEINEMKRKDNLQKEGSKLVAQMKSADTQGLDMTEFCVALGQSGEKTPSDWLNQEWREKIDTCVAMVASKGHLHESYHGQLSRDEARRSLIEHDADLDAAINHCLEKRKQVFSDLMNLAEFPRDKVSEFLLQEKGNYNSTKDELYRFMFLPFCERIWENPMEDYTDLEYLATTNREYDFTANSVIRHDEFQQQILNSNLETDRRIRMVLVEAKLLSWGRAQTVIRILDKDKGEVHGCSVEDIIDAVRNHGDIRSSLQYLQQDCGCCYSKFPMSKIRNLTFCQCKICVECIAQHFEVVIRERFVQNWSCPLCEQPDIQKSEAAEAYFGFLKPMLQTMVAPDLLDLFEVKLRDWNLMKDPNFRWCALCGNGFIYNGQAFKMACPGCNGYTCFHCKKPWADQHDDLTCEQFYQWKIENDPENQAVGLARHLDANGIDCPNCKMRYVLAKGGCMHFRCIQCGHEFCSGCSQPFHRIDFCNKYKSCERQGLHCHHPRDCFFYLRDSDVADLHGLIQSAHIAFDTEPPPAQTDIHVCPVIEQKELSLGGKRDEPCEREVERGHAGLCVIHYKEYLVSLINRNGVDPVIAMSVETIHCLLLKHELNVPKLQRGETPALFRNRLIEYVKRSLPLPRQQAVVDSEET